MAGFGNKFKSARESRDLKFETIAQETRIAARFLRAIEEEEFHILPGGVFNRGFIRTYAGRVGLDPEKAVSEYKELVAEPGLEESELHTRETVTSSEGHILPIAIGSLVVVIVLFYVFASDTGTQTEAAIPETSEIASTEDATVPETEMALAGTPAPASQPAPTTPPVNEASISVDRINVQLDVHDDTWVAIESDGEAVVQGAVLTAGTTRSFSASGMIEVTIGNAAGLTLRINGQPVPNLGRDGQVRILTITPDNVSRYTGS